MPDQRFKRLQEIEREEKRLRKEKEALAGDISNKPIPEFPIPRNGIREFRGATYQTWFKAAGAMEGVEIGDSPKLLDEEFDEMDLPRVFYSQAITGKVRYHGIVDREYVIGDLNEQAPWAPHDFRDIYPTWEYRYRVIEFIGRVPVREYVHVAKSNPNKREARRGVKRN